jgi:glyoxylase-like metal-dependent hydrolase (beta-lactamase superfamily II)
MIFKQLFEPVSCTYTYLLGCPQTGQAILIDPVAETVERDLDALGELNLKLSFTLETHIHADHLTGARKLKTLVGSKIVVPRLDNLSCADIGVAEGEDFKVGSITLHPLLTPGHTDHHHCYLVEGDGATQLFSGDCLLIDGCGRTDFQSGSSEALYRSVRDKLFVLPNETLVYPAHDYQGRFVTSIGQEKKRNPRLALTKSLDDFVALMKELKLPYPKKMEFAVPGNQMCGVCPKDVPEALRSPCEISEQG